MLAALMAPKEPKESTASPGDHEEGALDGTLNKADLQSAGIGLPGPSGQVVAASSQSPTMSAARRSRQERIEELRLKGAAGGVKVDSVINIYRTFADC